MSVERLRLIYRQHPWEIRAIVFWVLLGAGLMLRGGLQPRRANTYPCFRDAALNWYSGLDLYQQAGSTCRYSPVFHAALVPFAVLPDWAGGALWRLLNHVVFLGGLVWWSRSLLPPNLRDSWRGLVLLSTLPLALGSLDNAQSNPLMIGVMLIAVTAVSLRRWNLAAFGLAVACFLKIYPVALALLLSLAYPRQLVLRFLACLSVGLVLPFALQDPAYVARQYGNWLTSLKVDDRSQIALHRAYRDLWLLIRLTNLPVSWTVYRGLQLLGAALVAGLVLLMRWRHVATPSFLNLTLGLCTCWIALLGPTTESSTYIALAPIMGWCLADLSCAPRSRAVRCLVVGSLLFFLLARLAGMLPGAAQLHSFGPHPLGALFLLLAVVLAVCRVSFVLSVSQEPHND